MSAGIADEDGPLMKVIANEVNLALSDLVPDFRFLNLLWFVHLAPGLMTPPAKRLIQPFFRPH